MINRISVLLIQDDIKTIADITAVCLDAGISERHIFSVAEADSAERYLEIAGISCVVVDASLYNYVVSSTIEKFSQYYPIKTVITNAKPEHKTLRMLNDKSLTFVDNKEELVNVILGRGLDCSYKQVL
jgi:hypothetical protein